YGVQNHRRRPGDPALRSLRVSGTFLGVSYTSVYLDGPQKRSPYLRGSAVKLSHTISRRTLFVGLSSLPSGSSRSHSCLLLRCTAVPMASTMRSMYSRRRLTITFMVPMLVVMRTA